MLKTSAALTLLPLLASAHLFAATPAELRVLQDIKVLASDEFEGRAPGSPGEEKTVNFLIQRFKELGLQPGNPNGSFIQDVPLVGSTVVEPHFSFVNEGTPKELSFPAD